MEKIKFCCYPDVNGEGVKIKYLPRKGEEVFYKNNLYQVSHVVHNIDNGFIKVFMYIK